MEPLYRQEGNQWVPNEYTLGPLPDAQHGGAVAGVTLALVESEAARLEAGEGVMVSICQLRPAPLSPAEIRVETIRQGRRSTCLRAETYFEEKLTAVTSVVFSRPMAAPNLPPHPEKCLDPERGKEFILGEIWPGKNYGQALEIRLGDEKVIWLRPTRPAVEGLTPLARICSMADMSPGISMIASGTNWRKLVKAFPTTDLTVHLARPPLGEWVGMQATTHWYDNGLGLTETALLDQAGPLGRIAQSFAVIPLNEG